MPGIDDAAFFQYTPSNRINYQETVDYCQSIGGKSFEPTATTNGLVSNWAKEKSSYNFWLGIKWNNNTSEFQYLNGTKISWSNFRDRGISITSCGEKSCKEDDAAVGMDPGDGKWYVAGRSERYTTAVCETTVS